MLKNFLIVTFRQLFKNKIYVGINIVGLGLALACCIVAYQNAKYDWDFDANHAQIDKIYKFHGIRENKGVYEEYGRVPMPLATTILAEIPSADRIFRFEAHVFTVRDAKLGYDKVFNTSVCYADEGFLESFTFPVVQGSAEAYHTIDQAVVSQRYAQKFYGDENPIGRVLTVFDDSGMSFNFIIGAVVADVASNSSVRFDMLLNFENRFRMYDDGVRGNWEAFAQSTFAFFEDPSKVAEFEALLLPYVQKQQEAKPDFKVEKFQLVPMSNHAHAAREVRWEALSTVGPPAAVITPQVMAILILLIACFNFTNTAIANSNRRLKEIGIRKVLGGSRKQLIRQFMLENLTVCTIALLLSIALAIYMVPAYGAMWDGMNLEIDFKQDYLLYVYLVLLLLFTTVVAGLYPSLYISKYAPVSILRGGVSIKGAGKLTKVLLATQYTFTVIAIFASVAFIQNARYQETLDLGYDHEQVIGINLLNANEYAQIKTSMLANADIVSFATAKNHIGRSNFELSFKDQQGVEVESSVMEVGMGYVETMGLEVLDGRSFIPEFEGSDNKKGILVNEKLVEAFGWADPIGQYVAVNDTTQYKVVGVLKDFYMFGFWAPMQPAVLSLRSLRFNDDGTYSFIVAKTNSENTNSVFDYLEAEWNKNIPNKTFAGFYQDDLLSQARKVNRNILTIFSFLGVIAFVLSSLGLFTLVSINLVKRTKEIGVRKVLGGSVKHIVLLVGSNYLILLTISSAIGVVAGYYLIDALISSIFTNYKEMDWITVTVPFLSITLISLAITAFRTIQSAIMNPVNSLRNE
ncbi:MAG: putative ABC transport system permease protein [Cyclobacteriaceae bacterium]|jgi:putative ABC transport system permease protein